MRTAAVIAALALAACASPPPATAPEPGEPSSEQSGDEVALAKLDREEISLLRASCNTGSEVEAGPVSVRSSSYTCEVLRTYAAIEATEGRGFVMGGLPRLFLRMRLITKGIFAGVFGLLGLG